ncbi:SIS domain-containing protein [Rhizobium nepotum]|uniref:SIS domain-containing protein n=1 Tax=Rhizobium nepotum TaxID=1035271 RepID=UPI003CF2C4B1
MFDFDAYFNGAAEAVTVVGSTRDQIETVVARLVEAIGRGGKVVLVGIGKSGHICRKVCGSFNSYGVTSLFLHASECAHGDLGALDRNDVVILVSRSGASTELFPVLNFCSAAGIATVAISSNISSALVREAEFAIVIPKTDEAVPHRLAPTYSTLSALVALDAIFVATIAGLGLEAGAFMRHHPGGALGQLGRSVEDVMQTKPLPLVRQGMTLRDSIVMMTTGMVGCVGVVDEDGILAGIFTDGDLRRGVEHLDLSAPIDSVSNANITVLEAEMVLSDVVSVFRDRKIPSAFVCRGNKPIGIVHIRHLTELQPEKAED